MSFTQNKIYNLLNVQEHTGLKFKLFGKKNKKQRVTNEINKKLPVILLTLRVGQKFYCAKQDICFSVPYKNTVNHTECLPSTGNYKMELTNSVLTLYLDFPSFLQEYNFFLSLPVSNDNYDHGWTHA